MYIKSFLTVATTVLLHHPRACCKDNCEAICPNSTWLSNLPLAN